MTLLTTAINRFFALDSESATRLAGLEGKIVRLELRTTPVRVFVIAFKNQQLEILSDIPEHCDLIIKGTPLSLLHMALSKDKHAFLGKDIIIEGNLELGQQVTDLFDQMDIDWEEHLSRWIGDVPAYQTGKTARSFRNFSRKLRTTLLRNVNEYIHEEAEFFPTREALQDFFHDVDQLRMDVDRIDARIQKIIRDAK